MLAGCPPFCIPSTLFRVVLNYVTHGTSAGQITEYSISQETKNKKKSRIRGLGFYRRPFFSHRVNMVCSRTSRMIGALKWFVTELNYPPSIAKFYTKLFHGNLRICQRGIWDHEKAAYRDTRIDLRTPFRTDLRLSDTCHTRYAPDWTLHCRSEGEHMHQWY